MNVSPSWSCRSALEHRRWQERRELPEHGHPVKKMRPSSEDQSRKAVASLFEGSRWLLTANEEAEREACDSQTLERARAFLERTAVAYSRATGSVLPMPVVSSGPECSIDLFWESEQYELLMNFPADPEKPAGFYGDDLDKTSIKGTFDPTKGLPGIVSWFMAR